MDAVRRWILLAVMVCLGIAYMAAFAYLSLNSVDFVVDGPNRLAQQYAAQHPIVAPVAVGFGEGTEGSRLLGGGWHRPDPEGTWMGRGPAWLYLAGLNSSAATSLRIRGRLVPVPGGLPSISVVMDGQAVARWPARDGNLVDLTVAIPEDALSDGQLEVRFETDRSYVPRDADLGSNGRALSFRLETVSTMPL